MRQAVERKLRALGWKEHQLIREWSVPATPHDLTKRERGQRYERCGRADIAALADDSGEPYALQVLFEFKEPTIDEGRMQLMRYLASEPVVRMGYWTNGTKSLAVYKSHTNDWVFDDDAPLPGPGDDLTAPPDEPPTWKDLENPTEAQLAATLKSLVATVVIGDSRATRREDQLRELLHILLVKIDSDAIARRTGNQHHPVAFRLYGDKQSMVKLTADQVRRQFRAYFTASKKRVFHPDDRDELLLTDETLFAVVDRLWRWRILGDSIDVVSKAFQIFRTQALKSGEGQFLTPQRVIRPCVMAMEVTSSDKVIDPACGTGGFLIEALRQVQEREFPDEADSWNLVKWANEKLYGVDIDPLGTKLTRAMMIASQDGSTHVLRGDAVRRHMWPQKFTKLVDELGDGDDYDASFTVVLTNPPFGEDLKVKASEACAAGYTIALAAGYGKTHVNLEIGLIFLELAHRLLQIGGRVGIVLPETYWFSYKYRWLPAWMEDRFEMRGMFNIAMEAFEEFCRAKTNFYILEKVGNGPEDEVTNKESTPAPAAA